MSNTTDREDIIRKVQALLQKTVDKGATDSEAMTAMTMAQKLMVKYHLDMAELKDSSERSEEVVTGWTGRKAMAQWSIKLLHLVASNFRCKSFLSNHTAVFLGEDTDVRLAVEMFRMLYDFMDKGTHRIRKQYRKEGRSTDGVADSYLRGFLAGLREALDAQKAAEPASFALVLVTPEAVIKAHQELMAKPDVTTVHGRQMGTAMDPEAYHLGQREGRNALNKRLQA